jgi:S1/P1 Nuclease
MELIKKISVLVFSVSLSLQCFAWGATGHRVIGEIAGYHLTAKAKQSVKAILGNESIAIASNWADFVKSDSNMNYLYNWHFINLKTGMNKTEFTDFLKTDTTTNAYTKLVFLIKELKKKNLALAKKQLYLRLLIHIAGDIHQPMHVSRAEDQGGNKIKVLWFNDPTNLHSVWDDKLIELQKLSYSEYTSSINHSTLAERKNWQKQPMTEWFYESNQLADKIYSGITQPDQKLGYRYNYENIATVNQQLLKGGIRLAGLLNEIFK